MSGLETAIRNALDRSNRADREIRARIYQSARQALDAGLRKQGVTDRLIIMQQHELLERKIHEIEMAEVERLAEPAPEPTVELDPELPYAAESMAVESPVMEARPRPETPQRSASPPPVAPPIDTVSGETRSPAPTAAAAAMSSGDLGGVSPARGARIETQQFEPAPQAKAAKPGKTNKSARPSSDSGLDVPPERAAKPRKRRSFLSHLLTWFITLGVVGGACWWFYQSGLVQSIVEEAMKSADRSVAGQGSAQGPTAFDPRSGFSDDWVEIFVPAKAAEMKAGGQAKIEAIAASEGQAVRIASATSGDEGDVSVDVPPEVLREMAGKSSTVALTLQSGQNSSVQLSVRCDFGSLGSCSRHRFTATQEKLEALFRVTFERSLAPNRPGRLIFNSGIDGAGRAVLLYSVRILPGQ
ncbi:hypothetical protein NOJ28_00660 [Neorhizobium galegae]|uniref:hypothetical protein n=1 Tax=Neorhizobium galegae TaxID=399 RepID=UPI000622A800|nr:hypothetical protein [Neorhizobium galegae]MCQ1764026.1 hypothetical protein [Neorhizobium galegae]MCQ1846533.1 hypothetical protein [Neorhizobium galegae]CDZ35446.1 Regulator protein [Neorhizobium galegae bv. officinalis]